MANFQVPGTTGTYKIVLTLLKAQRTDSYVRCREYCEEFEINTARHLLSAIFIARYLKYQKQKTEPPVTV